MDEGSQRRERQGAGTAVYYGGAVVAGSRPLRHIYQALQDMHASVPWGSLQTNSAATEVLWLEAFLCSSGVKDQNHIPWALVHVKYRGTCPSTHCGTIRIAASSLTVGHALRGRTRFEGASPQNKL